ncbi:reverse transcriptase [Lasius niger]|uniref:Reverse transcriptase n=1 Tax=Lasius niger TaxID=67767 RepID=A0A0J7NAV8_LASNI|nr:reverse transcriptase [Lasius niger]
MGNTPTCVRPQGSSIVDLTWSSPDLAPMIIEWKVMEDMESLSDHVGIRFDVCTGRPRLPIIKSRDRRWNLRKFDGDFFRATLIWGNKDLEAEDEQDLGSMIGKLDELMEEACDASAPRIGPRRPHRKAYWWQDSVALMRSECIHARRAWQRAKRRKRSLAIINELGLSYKTVRKNLRLEINRLKAKAWQELIETIDNDPWGLPYKVVMGKLRPTTPGLSELLEHDVLSGLLDSLFPRNNRPDPLSDWSDFEWSDDWSVSMDELKGALGRGSSSLSKAPGPDGFRLVLWKRVPAEVMGRMKFIFNACLKKGEFPDVWKRANLVLIPKAGSQNTGAVDAPKARPICLLDELGKTFERVLANRIYLWQVSNPESDISKFQFGFRKQRSTCDALLLVRELTSTATRNGGFAFVVSLDISNAFNSLPWRLIRRALGEKNYPRYLRRVLDSYLADRKIFYVDKDGRRRSRDVEAGVPQGSVLGPVLWNIAFDEVLSLAEDEEGSNIICYADDTLIIVTGRDLRLTQLRASLLVARTIIMISRLGLKVAKEKTEAILFHGREVVNLPTSIMVGDTPIKFSSSVKYLGIIIDINWLFFDHFRYVEEKANRVVRALYRLMPNLRGPDERRRRLFANVVLSVVLYGAPVWGDRIVKKSCTIPALHRLHRTIAQRVISAYRTVSSNAALLLARLPPIKLLATVRKRSFERIKELRDNGNLDPISRREIREEELVSMCNTWRALLEKPNTPGEFTKLAIVPRLESWLNRDTINGMTFHLTQIFTGHGCFSKFLHMIGKKADPMCFACNMDDTDDVYHTLRECPMWDIQRLTMREKLGLPRDFTLGDVVDIIVASRGAWLAFSAFVKSIMREKEEIERRIERARLSSSASSSSPAEEDEEGFDTS